MWESHITVALSEFKGLALIVPIHKKRSRIKCENYRGMGCYRLV